MKRLQAGRQQQEMQIAAQQEVAEEIKSEGDKPTNLSAQEREALRLYEEMKRLQAGRQQQEMQIAAQQEVAEEIRVEEKPLTRSPGQGDILSLYEETRRIQDQRQQEEARNYMMYSDEDYDRLAQEARRDAALREKEARRAEAARTRQARRNRDVYDEDDSYIEPPRRSVEEMIEEYAPIIEARKRRSQQEAEDTQRLLERLKGEREEEAAREATRREEVARAMEEEDRRQQELARQRQEEAQRRQEEIRRQQEEEAQRRQEVAQRRQEEARRQQEATRKRREADNAAAAHCVQVKLLGDPGKPHLNVSVIEVRNKCNYKIEVQYACTDVSPTKDYPFPGTYAFRNAGRYSLSPNQSNPEPGMESCMARNRNKKKASWIACRVPWTPYHTSPDGSTYGCFE